MDGNSILGLWYLYCNSMVGLWMIVSYDAPMQMVCLHTIHKGHSESPPEGHSGGHSEGHFLMSLTVVTLLP